MLLNTIVQQYPVLERKGKNMYWRVGGNKRVHGMVLKAFKRNPNTYLYDSEISAFNNSESIAPVNISNEFLYVVKRALHWAKKTDGAFDITLVPLLYLWGFGPGQKGGLTDVFPDEESINKRKIHMGYNKLMIKSNQLVKNCHHFYQ